MAPDAVHPGAPPPLPNEIIAFVMLIGTISGVGYLLWRVQRDGLMAFRKSALFLVVIETIACAYYAAYAGIGAWR